ncbi:MAG: ABC transporter permease [Methanosarcinaceae archaeon]|nr:ABC transporter permease [Methanosarcinaceae archaeon]MDD4749422.1 ABC transporter permease [Methanosarcinaceae archaeon]
MNFLEIRTILEDELFQSSKSRYSWFFGGIFIFLSLIAIKYGTKIYTLYSFFFLKFEGVPYSLISYLLVLALGPFFVLIIAFDSISSEIETGSIRYIISKVQRSSFILGKGVSLFLGFTIVLSGIAFICLIYQYFADNAIQFEKIFFFWLGSLFYLGSFISIFLFISTLSANNKISFVMSLVFLGILIYFYLQGGESLLKYLSPYSYGIDNLKILKESQIKTEFTGFFKNLFFLFLYTLSFLSLSLFAMKRRDL